MPYDAEQKVRREISLDARDLMFRVETEPYDRYFFDLIVQNRRVLPVSEQDSRSEKTPMLLLTVNWPKMRNARVSGVAWVTNPSWDMVFRPIPLTGEPKRSGGWMWRFTCPNTHKLVQTLYLDREAAQFVSREAIGRPRREANSARIVRHFMTLVDMGNLAGGVDGNFSPIAKPKHMSQEIFEALENAIASQFICFHLAVCNLPEPSFGDDGSIIIPTPSRRRSR